MKNLIPFFTVLILFGCTTNNSLPSTPKYEKEIFNHPEKGMVPETKFTISELDYSVSPQPEGTLTPEEAAEIGAAYIWDVLGISVENSYVQLMYSPMETHTRTYWIGTFADSDNFESGGSFYFSIDAVTGERIDLTSSEGIERFWEDESVRDPEMKAEEIEDLLIIAKDYAQLHFNKTNVVKIQFRSEEASGLAMFVAIDETGREAVIYVQRQTQQLYSIETLFNDLDPNLEGPVG